MNDVTGLASAAFSAVAVLFALRAIRLTHSLREDERLRRLAVAVSDAWSARSRWVFAQFAEGAQIVVKRDRSSFIPNIDAWRAAQENTKAALERAIDAVQRLDLALAEAPQTLPPETLRTLRRLGLDRDHPTEAELDIAMQVIAARQRDLVTPPWRRRWDGFRPTEPPRPQSSFDREPEIPVWRPLNQADVPVAVRARPDVLRGNSRLENVRIPERRGVSVTLLDRARRA